MNGRKARALRKYTRFRWSKLTPLYQAKLRMNWKRLYRMFKDQYHLAGRSMFRLVRSLA